MNGPKIIFTLPFLGGIPVTETVVNFWIVMAIITLACIFLTSNMQKVPKGKQILAEKLVSTIYDLVKQTMGSDKLGFAPYIGTLFIASLLSSLMGLFTLRPPTADLNTTLAWSLITFFLIQINAIRKKRVSGWAKSLAEPIPVMLPMNIVSELSNPVSMSFRHFGNIAAGLVITSLLYSGLAAVSTMLFGVLRIPLDIPFLQLGLPAILSIYFDLFTSVLQAFIFCMLTMVFVSTAMD